MGFRASRYTEKLGAPGRQCSLCDIPMTSTLCGVSSEGAPLERQVAGTRVDEYAKCDTANAAHLVTVYRVARRKALAVP